MVVHILTNLMTSKSNPISMTLYQIVFPMLWILKEVCYLNNCFLYNLWDNQKYRKKCISWHENQSNREKK